MTGWFVDAVMSKARKSENLLFQANWDILIIVLVIVRTTWYSRKAIINDLMSLNSGWFGMSTPKAMIKSLNNLHF